MRGQWRLGALPLVAAWLTMPATTLAAQSVVLTYANAGPFANSNAVDNWQLRVNGAYVAASDSASVQRWSVSPSERTAQDCDGITHLALDLQDANGDGRINAAQGDRARLVITSSWRNGEGWASAVMVLDVSEPAPPRTLWRKDNGNMAPLARVVAEPALGAIGNLPASSRQVLLGAGLPTPATSTHGARSGAALLALDIDTGKAMALDTPAAFTAGLSGAITALDLDHDGDTDRLYLGDAQATLWRFDLDDSAATNASAKAVGGPIARLAVPSSPNARSILAAPDVTRFAPPGVAPWLNIAVGTTYVGTGTSPVAQGLYVLRDPEPDARLTQAQFDALPIATPANLLGGYSESTGTDGIMARALTAAGVLLYTQVQGDALNTCSSPSTLVIKASAIQADTGTVITDASDGTPMKSRVLRRRDGSAPSPFDEPALQPSGSGYRCGIGDLPFDACPPIPRIKRRAWRREDAD